MNNVVCYLRSNLDFIDLISEFTRFIRIILTIPVSNATCERSYSTLRRLKTFVRNSLCAERLNNMTFIHVHKIDVDEPLIDEFISRSTARINTFTRNVTKNKLYFCEC